MKLARWTLGVLCLVCAATAAGAAPRRMSTGDYDHIFFRGDADNLPVGTFVTPDDAISWALTMPRVVTALQEMQARGYVAHPDYNRAGITSNPYGTHVFFAFEKPGLLQTEQHASSPVLVVSTFIDGSGTPYTTVVGGIIFVDRNTGQMFTADSLAAYRDSDPSFEIENAGGGGDSGDPLVIPVKKVYRTGVDPELRNKLIGFAGCAALANTAVIIGTVRWAPAMSVIAPWAAVTVAVGLVMLATAGCAWSYFGPH
jgi:hypothetical protein